VSTLLPIDQAQADTGRAFRPPRRRRLSEWADEHYYLSAESAADVGRWRAFPYQRGIMDAFTDPRVVSVAVMKSARVGFTKVLNTVVGYYMHQDPCPLMVVQPTLEDAQGYSKEEIAPMLRDCPALATLAPEARAKDADNTILHKIFPGGSLSLVGANSARGFRRVSRKVVLFDEVDGYPPSAGAEGDQIKLGIRRTDFYWDRKIGYGSTPTVSGRSRIETLFEEGDQRRRYVPCPHCGFMQVLQFANFRWPKGRPEDAVYVCIGCGAEIAHEHKRAMDQAGEWRPGPHPQFPDVPPPPPFDGHVSFHIWAAYSLSPNASWGQLCKEFASAEKSPDVLKTVVNTWLGETWKDKGEAPEWERLYQRRESYDIARCPLGVLFLTAGVDVQKDRLVYEVVGWGRGKESWSIESGVLLGETANLHSDVWTQLDALLERAYPSPTEVYLSIRVLAIDSGYNTQTVYNWGRKKPPNKVIAVKGLERSKVLVGTPSPVDISIAGRMLKRGYRVWPLGVDVAKTELYGWLKIDPPTDEARAAGETYAPGYCHFPQYGEEFFKQLTAEQLVPHRKRNGFTVHVWEKIPGRENHQLDCRVYARAAALVAGLDRLSDADWLELARIAGQEQLALPLADGPTAAPAAPVIVPAPRSSTPSAPVKSSSAWIPRRPGFLR
jgi:phage terminase large subunit GpA-like protein